MSEPILGVPVSYKNPPIIERALSVTGDIKPETFYSQFESWRPLIQKDFPEYDPIKEWLVQITQNKDGMPLLEQSQPEVRVTHRFWRRNEAGNRFLSMRILPDQLILNLLREEGVPHRYKELRAELEQWLPKWITHFAVTGCSRVQLEYVNLLSAKTTPQFSDNQGGLRIGNAIKVFAQIPTPHLGIIPPYDCQMGLRIDPKRQAAFHLRVRGLLPGPGEGVGVRVDFLAVVDKGGNRLPLSDVLNEADFLHGVMLDHFEAIFTDEAKQSFEPEK